MISLQRQRQRAGNVKIREITVFSYSASTNDTWKKKKAELSFTSSHDRHGNIAPTYFISLAKVVTGLIIHYAF